MPKRLLALALLFLCSGLAHAAPVYFVVSELDPSGPHGDSYILPLEAAADIAHARDLIANGAAAGATIVVAQIAPGSDGINRDVLAPGEPLWSWHVTAFSGFADYTIEILDGWPSYVEQDVAGWIANTNGTIGFWNYTVTAELPAAVPLPGALLMLVSGTFALVAFGKRR